MSRFVEPRRAATEDEQAGGGTTGDDYSARVAKYVPAEVVAAYVAILAVLDPAAPGADPARTRLLCRVAFLVLWACTPLYLSLLGRGRRRGAPAVQLVVSSLAFVVWAYALRGLSCAFPAIAFDGKTAFVALVLFTVLSGLATPPPRPSP
jgi:hypothetical protein